MSVFQHNNPSRKQCKSCGHEMLTDDEIRFLADDVRYSVGILIRNHLHNTISQEIAESLVEPTIAFGMINTEQMIHHGHTIHKQVFSALARERLKKAKDD